jgi:cytoskeleton-associated protein 5
MSFTSTLSEEKENGDNAVYPRSKLSPEMRHAGSAASSGRGSPARGFRRDMVVDERDNYGAANAPLLGSYGGHSSDRAGSHAGSRVGDVSNGGSAAGTGSGSSSESWKRAAEVTNQLKARIEQMKVRTL